ncbi:hypothetical protein BATDEDRAFT_23219 [Batrachochytrium dendrobatidis JAM81]|uniref:Uncharacterized protein n=2 Tax=Batrachochytrium dendrobatidis TaxID=109871 RepID=F4NYC5_BATDJ|nr:uncharacterized protein BATDEDRAFT_23219 [Batrachochytrium dendrobatidis JAM81]EGF81691.1 hypothetical protein BATDEDRAFT_23219 [Batrachochytrium dendrobatidis JAM81]OAJ40086.1 hypothetical protein BDEG_23863 [Batrachochytrium dendrobatidis JEL423]|eukprot:XP_006677224.1 hypothetical protein BATDEDRAFT_23219 [Batrachochytrium dendrobatidis JAM81]
MKLAVAVLSSILLACSVTIANPVDPSATTSTESITSPTHNPNGIGLGGLDPIPNIIKDLLKEYIELEHGRDEQEKLYGSLKPQYDHQHKLVKRLKKKIQVLGYISQASGDGPEYNGEIRKNKLDFEIQKSKLANLKKSLQGCESKSYLEKQSLKYNKSLGRKPSDQQQRRKPSDQQSQDSQPSPDTPSGSVSGYFEQRVPSNKRKGFSKFMNGLKSLFQRSKNDDSSN